MINDSPWNKFVQVLKKLSKDEQNQELWRAIESWCNELSSDEIIKLNGSQIKSYIQEWIYKPSIGKFSYEIYIELLLKLIYHLRIPLNWIPDEIKNQIPNPVNINNFKASLKEIKSEMNIKYILLVAFVLTGVGVGLYLLDNNQKKSKGDRTSRTQPDHNRRSQPESTRQLQPNILILVINAENNERIIDTLKRENKVTSENWENLYNSMEALWMGEKRELNETGLNSNLSASETSERSEYDVYFINIELQQYDQGFDQNRNSLERLDAFERLTQTTHTVKKISQRLSIQSTENSYLYR